MMLVKSPINRKIYVGIIIVPVAIIIGTLLMIGVYLLPTDAVTWNIQTSLPIYEENDKSFTFWANGKFYSQVMNFTDAIMLNTAIFRPTDSCVENAMRTAHAIYSNSTEQYQNLSGITKGEEGYIREDYPRYWHGYLLYLIPALYFMDAGEMRVAGMVFQAFSAVILFYLLGKRNKLLMLMWCPVMLFINPITTALTFQMAIVYCITTITMIVIAKYYEKLERGWGLDYLFVISGVSVAFFDFLTYPLVALGVPLILVLFLNDDDIKRNLIKTLRLSVGWGYGYVGMWFGKWAAGSVLTHTNLFTDAFGTIAFRTHGKYDAVKITYSNTLRRVWNVINDIPMKFLLMCTIGLLIYYILKKEYRIRVNKMRLVNTIPIIIVGTYPFFWYFFVMNHSVIHPMMSYRELSILIWALLSAIVKQLPSSKTEG